MYGTNRGVRDMEIIRREKENVGHSAQLRTSAEGRCRRPSAPGIWGRASGQDKRGESRVEASQARRGGARPMGGRLRCERLIGRDRSGRQSIDKGSSAAPNAVGVDEMACRLALARASTIFNRRGSLLIAMAACEKSGCSSPCACVTPLSKAT